MKQNPVAEDFSRIAGQRLPSLNSELLEIIRIAQSSSVGTVFDITRWK
jgi:hypothetical protein